MPANLTPLDDARQNGRRTTWYTITELATPHSPAATTAAQQARPASPGRPASHPDARVSAATYAVASLAKSPKVDDLAAEPRVPPLPGPPGRRRAAGRGGGGSPPGPRTPARGRATRWPGDPTPFRPPRQPGGQLDQEPADRELRQHQHDDQRRVGVLGLQVVLVGRSQLAGPERPVDGRRRGVRRVERRGQELARLGAGADVVAVDHCGCESLHVGMPGRTPEPRPARSRSPHMSHLRTIPLPAWNLGTSYGQASVQYWQPKHWSSRCLTIPVTGSFSYASTGQAFRQAGFEAVVARRGHVLEHRQRRRPADEQADVPPGLRRRPARSRRGRPPRTPCSPNSGRDRPRRRAAGRGRASVPAAGPSSIGPGAVRPCPRGTARIARRRSGRPARSGASRSGGRLAPGPTTEIRGAPPARTACRVEFHRTSLLTSSITRRRHGRFESDQ